MAIYMWREYVPPRESIIIKIKADSSGVLKIPVAWYNTSWSQRSVYNWKVSVDDWAETTYSWTWSATAITIATWLTANSEHKVMITPTTEDYLWARAFWFSSSWVETLLTEVIYDWSYMWYGSSATYTWDYFRYLQYYSTSIVTAPDEYLPDTVTSIWREFRGSQYYQCKSLLAAPEEVLPSSVTSIYLYYRAGQYYGNSALTEIKWWKDLNIWNTYYRENQFNSCNANKTIKVLSDVWYASYSAGTLSNSYVTQVQVPSAYLSNFKNSSNNPRVNIDDSKFVWY